MEWLRLKLHGGQQQQQETKCQRNLMFCDIWICSIKDIDLVDESSFDRIVDSVASETERERILKFVFAVDRKRALLSLLLQKALIQQTFPSIFSNVNSYTIRRTRENKPFLSVDSFPDNCKDCLGTWNFNVSHHGDYVAIGCSSSRLIGVDIVDVQTRSAFAPSSREYVQIYQQQLTPYELNYILDDSLSEDHQYHRFFLYWAMKEAYIKAIGQGLGYDLLRVEFHICENSKEQTAEVTNNAISWEGEAEVWVDGVHRSDWKCLFFPLDSQSETSADIAMQPRHLMALALGPISEALPSYQKAVWGDLLPSLKESPQDVNNSSIKFAYRSVSQLLDFMGCSL